jgi:hypothetical protein
MAKQTAQIDKIRFEYDDLRQKYSSLKDKTDAQLLPYLALKYYFYNDDNDTFEPYSLDSSVTDGANDGGIDAIITDPGSEHGDVLIIQAKDYQSAKLTKDNIKEDIGKIMQTVKDLNNGTVSKYSQKVRTAYENALDNQEDEGDIQIFYISTYLPKTKRERENLIHAAESAASPYQVEMVFADDVVNQIEMINTAKPFIEEGKLVLDEANNYLSYQDSIIVNISAKSLQSLQNKYGNSILSMNLRYFVKQKKVDQPIIHTMQRDPSSFWYKNNGIVIICEDYNLDGRVLKLYKFSIINGGQTTTLIGNTDIEEDFYLQCKVIVSPNESEEKKDKFAFDIAEATNNQKPIRPADLKANSPQQRKLHDKLRQYNIYYVTKKGDKIPPQYQEKWQKPKLENVGVDGLAGILLMPGYARNQKSKMYDDSIYNQIFGYEVPGNYLADLLKIDAFYEQFKKDPEVIHEIAQGSTLNERALKISKVYQLACLAFLVKLLNKEFTHDEIKNALGKSNPDDLKELLARLNKTTKIIHSSDKTEYEELLKDIFFIINSEVIGFALDVAAQAAENSNTGFDASNFLKSNDSFYTKILPRLIKVYGGYKSQLKKSVNLLVTGDENFELS